MIVTRFAPSPTGYLHLGHAYSALFAARAGDKFLLRIEDIDPVRCKPEFTEALMEDLHWLGLTWEDPVRQQSEHLADYQVALEKLHELGVSYPCFCTRSEILAGTAHAPHNEKIGPVYPGTCRKLPETEREGRKAQDHAFRLDMAKACALAGKLTWHDRQRGEITAHPESFGDIVLARKDVPTSYHLSVVVDDALQGITLVTRGEDLFRATDIHVLLQKLLGFSTPEYHHHKLLVNEEGKRYAKRERSVTLRSLREAGKTPEEVRQMASITF